MQLDQSAICHALIGGALIGLGATLLFAVNGRVAGISNMLASLLRPEPRETSWRVAFLLALVGMGIVTVAVDPSRVEGSPRPLALLVVAGLLVGIGTRVANGCTSGHGVCGVSRLSARSIAATCTFVATGMLSVTLLRLLGAGP
jgi:uncharacterized protein